MTIFLFLKRIFFIFLKFLQSQPDPLAATPASEPSGFLGLHL